jgi:hypothetical protein
LALFSEEINELVQTVVVTSSEFNPLEAAADESGTCEPVPQDFLLNSLSTANVAIQNQGGCRESIQQIRVRKLEDSWSKTEMSATYIVIANNYIGGAKNGYLEFGEGPDDKKVNTFVEYAQSFIDYAQSVNTLTSVPDDRASTQEWSDYLQFTVSADESGCLTVFSYNERVKVKSYLQRLN